MSVPFETWPHSESPQFARFPERQGSLCHARPHQIFVRVFMVPDWPIRTPAPRHPNSSVMCWPSVTELSRIAFKGANNNGEFGLDWFKTAGHLPMGWLMLALLRNARVSRFLWAASRGTVFRGPAPRAFTQDPIIMATTLPDVDLRPAWLWRSLLVSSAMVFVPRHAFERGAANFRTCRGVELDVYLNSIRTRRIPFHGLFRRKTAFSRRSRTGSLELQGLYQASTICACLGLCSHRIPAGAPP